MLMPANLYIDEIECAMRGYTYSDDMMYESGSLDNWIPEIAESPDGSTYQYAIVSNDKCIGYLSYHIDWYDSCAYNFGIISFDRGNVVVGKDLFKEMTKLIYEYKLHRIEWRMVSGNPVEDAYDRFCNRFQGRKLRLHDVFKDKYGNYRDSIIYEIIDGYQREVKAYPNVDKMSKALFREDCKYNASDIIDLMHKSTVKLSEDKIEREVGTKE